MAKAHRFGAVLARVRRGRGYPSAYAFYRAHEGGKRLGITYRNYMYVEQGQSLPRVESVEAILSSLGLHEHGEEARELVDAYFASLGLEGLERFRGPRVQASKPAEVEKVGDIATRQAVERISIHLSPRQWKLRAESFDAHICLRYLIATPGGAELSELAEMTGIGLGPAKLAVKALAAAGLAKVSGSRVRTPLEDKNIKPIPASPEMAGVLAVLERHRVRMIERAKLAHNTAATIRLSKANLRSFIKHLDELMDLTSLLDSRGQSEEDKVYTIAAQVYQLFPQAKR